jgi:hypothetical protein
MRSAQQTLSIMIAAAILGACGSENSLVGRRCQEGFTPSGEACTAPASAAEDFASAGDDDAMGSPATADDDGVGARFPGRDDAWAGVVPGVEPSPATEPDPPLPIVCDEPLVACHGECIAVDSDAYNCGACGKYCPTNMCTAGECQGSFPGDVVVIGHDFASASVTSSQSRVLTNAVSIATTDPIRVLSYGIGASAGSVSSTEHILHHGIRGRNVAIRTAADATELASNALSGSYDIVLVHDAAGDAPDALGASWADALGRFTHKGGVVIALDGGASDMPALLSGAGLLDLGSHAILPEDASLYVSAPNDVVGVQVLSPYVASGASVAFLDVAPLPDLTAVVRQRIEGEDGPAVVLHKVMR